MAQDLANAQVLTAELGFEDNGQALFGCSPKVLEARFVLNPEVILRDESRYHPDLYLVRLVRQGVLYCVDKVAFDCLVYLFQP